MADSTDGAVIARLSAGVPPTMRRAWNRHVRACTELTAAQRLVIAALADYADYADGTNAHPGEANLAAECGLTTRAVRAALARAQQIGLIARTALANVRTGRAAVYRLLPPPPITGTTVPVDNSITGTTVPVDNSITGTYASPSPERPFLPPSQHLTTTGGLRNETTSRAEPATDAHTAPASRFCAKHPRGYAGRCGDCANARTAFEAVRADAAANDVARAQLDDLERRRRRREIDACPICDEHGLADDGTGTAVVRCQHPTLGEEGRAHA